MSLRGIYETVVYAADIDAATAFYRDVLGLRLVASLDDLGVAFRLRDQTMLLIFDPRKSSLPDRGAPSHGPVGAGHVAFRVDSVTDWRARLTAAGVAIEQESSADGRSQLYFRDPAGNSLEVVDGELWPA